MIQSIHLDNFDTKALSNVLKVKIDTRKGTTIAELLSTITATAEEEIRSKLKETDAECRNVNPLGFRFPGEVLRHRASNLDDPEVRGIETKEQATAYLERRKDRQRMLKRQASDFLRAKFENVLLTRAKALLELFNQAWTLEDQWHQSFGLSEGCSSLSHWMLTALQEILSEHERLEQVAAQGGDSVYSFVRNQLHPLC